MMKLTPSTLLKRANDLKIIIKARTHIQISLGEKKVQGGSHGLRILDLFAQPLAFGEASKKLQSDINSMQDWADLNNTIVQFFKAGILETQNTDPTLSIPSEPGASL